MKTRPRKPKGISGSTVRYVERLAQLGERAIRRQFVAVDRRALRNGGQDAS